MNKSILKLILVAIPLLASVPAMAQFQSTSTMAGSGSAYASDPTIGADGAATYATAQSAIRRGALPGTEGGDDPNKEVQTWGSPIGPALPTLLLLAGAYAGVVAVRRRKQA